MYFAAQLRRSKWTRHTFQYIDCSSFLATAPSLAEPAAVSYHRVRQAAADGDGEWRDATLAVLPETYATWDCAHGGWDKNLDWMLQVTAVLNDVLLWQKSVALPRLLMRFRSCFTGATCVFNAVG